MVLPFQPLALTFHHVNYYVDMPQARCHGHPWGDRAVSSSHVPCYGAQADFCVPLLCLLAFMMCVDFGLPKRPCRPVLAAMHETDI